MNRNCHILLLLSCILLSCHLVSAQTPDTLDASRVTSRQAEMFETLSSANIGVLGHVASPTGDGDLVKRIQMVSGVSSGAEGSSAYYVRGGNIGNNQVTIDGVRIHGTSHLLGLTSSFSPDIISHADFRKGGFDGNQRNLTASSLSLTTHEGSFSGFSEYLSASNFLMGAGVSGPVVKDKVSILLSVRYSPAGQEYGIIRKVAGAFGQNLPERVDISVYDIYAKTTYRHDGGSVSSLSLFNSHDRYDYVLERDDSDGIGWDNYVLNYCHKRQLNDVWSFSGNASITRFVNNQTQYRVISGAENDLTVGSRLTECSVNGSFFKPGPWDQTIGFGIDYTSYLPGVYRAGDIKAKDTDRTLLSSLWYQAELARDYRYSLKAVARGDMYCPVRMYHERVFVRPECSLIWSQCISGDFGYELNADYQVQFYHLLEGLPVGWSADMIVPAAKVNPPESSWQGAASLYYRSRTLDIEIGPYYKHYDGLVYFSDATQLFNPVLGGWRQGTFSGTGKSYGLESSADFSGDRVSAHISYTLSKTMRHFDAINYGVPFRAKFDRPHMLNTYLAYSFFKSESVTHGVTASFVLQSGHLESLSRGSYELDFFGIEHYLADYFGEENSFRMSAYIRLDSGYFMEICKGRSQHRLDVGVYNMLNRHNPICLYYDADAGNWKQMSLFPVMPSLSYKVSF